MEAMDQIYMILVAGAIVPAVQWFKNRIGPDWPIKPVIVSAGLSLLCVWLLSRWLAPEMTAQEIIAYALATQVAGQMLHAGKKTIDG